MDIKFTSLSSRRKLIQKLVNTGSLELRRIINTMSVQFVQAINGALLLTAGFRSIGTWDTIDSSNGIKSESQQFSKPIAITSLNGP